MCKVYNIKFIIIMNTHVNYAHSLCKFYEYTVKILYNKK